MGCCPFALVGIPFELTFVARGWSGGRDGFDCWSGSGVECGCQRSTGVQGGVGGMEVREPGLVTFVRVHELDVYMSFVFMEEESGRSGTRGELRGFR